jgi:glycosyltransferase involved in cell wall biosynthesis
MAGFPTKFVEAITCGIPVVTNNTSDLQFYLKEGVNGYFLGYTKESISKKIKVMLNLDKNKLSDLKK